MEFKWGPAKRRSNIAKHSVDFSAMIQGFDDPMRWIGVDARFDYGELRYQMIAAIRGRIYHVTFTVRGETIWIISARIANRKERRRYGNE